MSNTMRGEKKTVCTRCGDEGTLQVRRRGLFNYFYVVHSKTTREGERKLFWHYVGTDHTYTPSPQPTFIRPPKKRIARLSRKR